MLVSPAVLVVSLAGPLAVGMAGYSPPSRRAHFILTGGRALDESREVCNTSYKRGDQMPKRKKSLTATKALLQAISESGLAFIELERRSGVKRQSIMKFVAGEQSLRLDLADRLMQVLGITVVMGPIPPVRKTRKARSPRQEKA